MVKHGSFTIGFFGTVLFFGIILVFLPLQYGGNDDISLAWILKGGDGFPPDDFLFFTSHLLNRTLFILYGLAPKIAWWGILITATVFMATLLFVGVLLRIGKRAIPVFPAVAYFIFHCLVYNSITTATLLLEISVLLCLFEIAVVREIPVARPRLYLALLACGLSFSLLMRWEVALVFLAMVFPILIVTSKPMVGRIIFIVLIAIAFLILDRAVYHTQLGDSEKEFAVYNRNRALFHDTKAGSFRESVTPKALLKVGWSKEDYKFFQNWLIFDEKMFNTKVLGLFLVGNLGVDTFTENKNHFLQNLRREWKLIAVLCLAVASLFTWRFRLLACNPNRRYPLLLTPMAAWAAIVCFVATRFVPWVYLPLFLLALGVTLLIVQNPGFETKGLRFSLVRKFSFHIAMAMQLFLVAALLVQDVNDLRQRSKECRFMSTCLGNAIAQTPVRTLIELHPASGIGLEKIHVFSEKLLPPGMSYFPGGWTVHSPRYRRILQILGWRNGDDFLKGLIGNQKMGLIVHAKNAQASSEILKDWEGYYHRNVSDANVTLESVHVCQDSNTGFIGIYKVAKTANSAVISK